MINSEMDGESYEKKKRLSKTFYNTPFTDQKLDKEASRRSDKRRNTSLSIDTENRSTKQKCLSSSSQKNVYNSIGVMQITYNNRPLSNTKIKFGKTPAKRDISNLSMLKAKLGSGLKSKTGFSNSSSKVKEKRSKILSNKKETLQTQPSQYESFDLGHRNNTTKEIYR